MSSIWLPKMTLRDAETLIIWQALAYFGGNKTHTARALKISLRTLRNRIRENPSLKEFSGRMGDTLHSKCAQCGVLP